MDIAPEVVAEIDWSRPTVVRDGRPEWVVRCRVPFTFECSESLGAPPKARAEGEAMEDDDDHEPGMMPDDDGNYTVSGISSSTSVDWYGTEMSKAALDSMAAQMLEGVPVVPTHWASEWDEQMGVTVNAVVQTAKEVQNPADPTEKAYVLRVDSKVWGDHPKCESLVKAIKRSQKIGRSIGGWFTELRFISNEEGDVERIIVEGVSLDHDAFTRRPANPDCWIDGLRSVLDARPEAQRKIRAVEKDGEAWRLVFEGTPESPTVARGATPFADLAIHEDRDAEWDAAEARDHMFGDGDEPDFDRAKKGHAWFDADDAETKGAYKLPFADLFDGTMHVVWKGLTAAMAALNGARGGADIPEDDREAVHALLARYYAKFDEEAPELKAIAPEHLRELNATVADACRAACEACAVACEAACRVCVAACVEAMEADDLAGCAMACATCTLACAAACAACAAGCAAACACCSTETKDACAAACAECTAACMAACSACVAACCVEGADVRSACDACAVACRAACTACTEKCAAACASCPHCSAIGTLDTGAPPRQDDPNGIHDAQSGAPESRDETPSPPPGDTMDPILAAKLDLALTTLATLNERLAAVEAAGKPAAETDAQRATRLEAELKAANERMVRMAREPVSRGRGLEAGMAQFQVPVDARITRARSYCAQRDLRTVDALLQDPEFGNRFVDPGPKLLGVRAGYGVDFAALARQAGEDLHTFFTALEADGLIGANSGGFFS